MSGRLFLSLSLSQFLPHVLFAAFRTSLLLFNGLPIIFLATESVLLSLNELAYQLRLAVHLNLLYY